jgi:hypothetical protein
MRAVLDTNVLVLKAAARERLLEDLAPDRTKP